MKAFESLIEGLKEDLTIIFKPTQRFTKKDLEGVDVMSINAKHQEMQDEIRGNPTLPQKEILRHKQGDDFINWFDLDGNNEAPSKKDKKNSVITLTKYDGSKTTLSEDLDKLLF